MADKKILNIHEKILGIMKKVQYLAKDDKVEFASTKYPALSEEKVTSSIRPFLEEFGVVIYPIKQEHTRVGTLSTVDVVYRIVNAEKPEDFIEVTSSGTGVDTQDKGVGKAMTYAYKYMILRAFAIPTGEDSDKISTTQLDEEEATRKAQKCEKISSELERTGYSLSTVLKKLQVQKLEDTSEEKLDEYIANFEKVPDKEVETMEKD